MKLPLNFSPNRKLGEFQEEMRYPIFETDITAYPLITYGGKKYRRFLEYKMVIIDQYGDDYRQFGFLDQREIGGHEHVFFVVADSEYRRSYYCPKTGNYLFKCLSRSSIPSYFSEYWKEVYQHADKE